MNLVLRRTWMARSGGAVLATLLASARYTVTGASHYRASWERGEPVIFVLWHGRLLPLAYLHRGQGVVGLVSRSRDGNRIATVLQRWGFGVVRGSSSHGGGRALRELVRRARAGASLALTPDGPRGPRQTMKLGPLVAAQLTGFALVPVAAGADRAWWPGSWDRVLIPRPFARIHVLYGQPRRVPRGLAGDALKRCAAALETELNDLTSAADGNARSA